MLVNFHITTAGATAQRYFSATGGSLGNRRRANILPKKVQRGREPCIFIKKKMKGQTQGYWQAASHNGLLRAHNEDSYAADPERGAFVVCDGMGGAAAGDVASKLACDEFLKVVRDPASDALVGCDLLRHALEESNRAVYREASANPALEGMGTTAVALLLDTKNNIACVAHAGDSRCYRWRKGKLEQLTSDHSYVEEQVRAGRMTQQEAEQSRMRNIITRALGSAEGGHPDATQFDTAPGDVFLLCTDGLTNEVPQIHIGEILSDEILNGENVSDAKAALTEACARLVEAALASGGHDNITAMLIEVP